MKTTTVRAAALTPDAVRTPEDPKPAAPAAKPKRTPTTPPGLPPLPKLPSKAKGSKPAKPCHCGCGTLTKGTWAPGHDGYVHGWAVRVVRNVVTEAQVPEVCRPAVREAIAKLQAKAKASKAA